jgi:hypothetical protein
MNLDSLVSNVCHGNINIPTAVVLCVLIIVSGWVCVTLIKHYLR